MKYITNNPEADVVLDQTSMLLLTSGAVEVINFLSLEMRLLIDECSVTKTWSSFILKSRFLFAKISKSKSSLGWYYGRNSTSEARLGSFFTTSTLPAAFLFASYYLALCLAKQNTAVPQQKQLTKMMTRTTIIHKRPELTFKDSVIIELVSSSTTVTFWTYT
jgi:hypothetical protein